MEAPEFKDFAKEMVDYIANYLENIRDRYGNHRSDNGDRVHSIRNWPVVNEFDLISKNVTAFLKAVEAGSLEVIVSFRFGYVGREPQVSWAVV